MKIKTKILGWLLQSSIHEPIVELGEQASLIDALRILFNQSVLDRIVKNNRITNEVIILINGVDANLLGGLNAPLKDGDGLTLIPVVHGG
ncbi:MAG: MoaD/ThiS family protein [Thermoprotei archaeon]